MKIPENLKHKPVIKVEDYDTVDGKMRYIQMQKAFPRISTME